MDHFALEELGDLCSYAFSTEDKCFGCQMQCLDHPNPIQFPLKDGNKPDRRYMHRFCNECMKEGVPIPVDRVVGVAWTEKIVEGKCVVGIDADTNEKLAPQKGKLKVDPWDRSDGDAKCCLVNAAKKNRIAPKGGDQALVVFEKVPKELPSWAIDVSPEFITPDAPHMVKLELDTCAHALRPYNYEAEKGYPRRRYAAKTEDGKRKRGSTNGEVHQPTTMKMSKAEMGGAAFKHEVTDDDWTHGILRSPSPSMSEEYKQPCDAQASDEAIRRKHQQHQLQQIECLTQQLAAAQQANEAKNEQLRAAYAELDDVKAENHALREDKTDRKSVV